MRKTIQGTILKQVIGHHDVTIYLPPQYNEAVSAHFPTLFLQDGDFLFIHQLNQIEQLIGKEIVPLILVGIEPIERNNEYTPWRQPSLLKRSDFGGNGKSYLSFLENTLIPELRKSFRISPFAKDLAIGGASLGGLISLYALCEKSELFSKYLLLSPSLWYGQFLTYMKETKIKKEVHVYQYVGQLEGINKTNIQRLMVCNNFKGHLILKENTVNKNSSLMFEIDPYGTHNDSFFIQYFLKGLSFLFPKG